MPEFHIEEYVKNIVVLLNYPKHSKIEMRYLIFKYPNKCTKLSPDFTLIPKIVKFTKTFQIICSTHPFILFNKIIKYLFSYFL